MSNWRNQSRAINAGLVSIMFGCFFLGTRVLWADCPNPDYYTTAIRLMRAFYPELRDKNVTLQIGAFRPFEADGPPTVFNVWISEVRPTEPIKASPNLSSAERVGHLSTHFEFSSPGGQPLLMSASGSFVGDERYQPLKALIDSHPEWDDAHISDQLSAAGARFGPGQKEAIIAKFPSTELAALLGDIEIESVQFDFRGNDRPPSDALLHWTIHFRTVIAGKAAEYFVSMEPFDGRVVMLGRGFGSPQH